MHFFFQEVKSYPKQTIHLGLAVPKIFHYSIIMQYSPGVDLYIVKLIICMPLETDLKMWKI